MNSSEITAFLAIVETRSISKAAEKLFTSQSTISNRLNALELEIGDILINRGQGIKSISVTPKGEEFLAFANKFMALSKDFEVWKQNTSRYELEVAAPMSINCYTLRDYYVHIVNGDFPMVLKPSSHWNFTIHNLLESFNLDIGIVSTSIVSKSLITKPLYSESLIMISNPEYSNYGDVVDARTLDINDEIFFDWGIDFERWHNLIWSPLLHPKVTVDSPPLIEFFLNSEDAWAIIPYRVAVELCKSGKLKTSKITPKLPKRLVYIIKQRNPNPSGVKAIEIFEKELRAFISESQNMILL